MKGYKLYNITDRKSGELIVIGPYTGSYGHFFCHYLPFIAKFRRIYPDARIVCSADHVFQRYAGRFCDYFYGFDHNWKIVLAPGSIKEETNEMLLDYPYIVSDDLGEMDLYIDTFRDGISLHNLYITAQDENLDLFRAVDYNPKSNVILLWRRFKLAATERNGSHEHWMQTADHLLSQGFQVENLGVPGAKLRHPDVYDHTTYRTPQSRSAITHNRLQEARCVVLDQSGVFNEAFFTGTPSLIFNCDPGHMKKIPGRNIFKTKLTFYTPRPWPHWQTNPLMDGDMSYMRKWLVEVDKFIKECETDKPYQYTLANHMGVFKVLDS